MIARANYSEEHIRELQKKSRCDPGLIERTLFAFGLLEALTKVGLSFTFKGGTSLMLLLSRPMRLSTDIDIVVKPGTDINTYIQKAAAIFPFKSGGEQERKARGKIEKRHFKFFYDSPVRSGKELYILLDVLFEENHYAQLVKKEIANSILLTEGENQVVSIPSVDCVLGDKLTAFAPYTTGIPLRMNKDIEVLKQFFDVSTLANEIIDFDLVRRTYFDICDTEIGYLELDITPADALMDSIQAAVCIGSRGKSNEDDFSSYLRGTRNVSQHIYVQNFSMERAALMAPQIIYLASCLLAGSSYTRVDDPQPYQNEKLIQPDMLMMKSLRRGSPIGYAYLVQADRLLSDYRK